MSREQNLEDAFLEGDVTVANLKMRPFSLGTLNLCRTLGLTMFTASDKDAVEALDDSQKQRQMATFAWMQSAPLPEVLLIVREMRNNPGSKVLEEKVEEFEMTVPVHLLPQLVKEVKRISELAASAAVEVQPKPGDKDANEPGNS